MTVDVLASPDARGAGESVRPRWEWRIFEPSPCDAFASLAAPGASVQASYEIYLLARQSPHNAKIRDGQLDVKRLDIQTTDGLELWRPVLKRHFPVSADDLARVFDVWQLAPPALRPAYTLDQFLRAVIRPNRDLRSVRVAKLRTRFTIGDCRAEHAVITAAGQRWETVAIEDEEPERILQARTLLTFPFPRPCSYPAALRRISNAFPAFTPTREPAI